MSDKVFGISASKPQETGAETKTESSKLSSTCVEVRLNMSTKKLKIKGAKANGWRHVSNLASGVVSFHEESGKVLLTFGLFTNDGNSPVPVWGFEPMLEKINVPGVDLSGYSTEQLVAAKAATIVGWEKIPLSWEGLEVLQKTLTGAPGLRAQFTLELQGSIVGQLQSKDWTGISISLILDLSQARAGKVSTYNGRSYRAIEVECISTRVEKSLPMGVPVKGIAQALETAKAVSLETEEEEDDVLFRETQYLAAFGQVGEIRSKSKAWKTHAEMLGSQNPKVVDLAVFCLGQLLSRGALKSANAQALAQQYGVKIIPVEGLPSTASGAEASEVTVTVNSEVVDFDGIEL